MDHWIPQIGEFVMYFYEAALQNLLEAIENSDVENCLPRSRALPIAGQLKTNKLLVGSQASGFVEKIYCF